MFHYTSPNSDHKLPNKNRQYKDSNLVMVKLKLLEFELAMELEFDSQVDIHHPEQ